MTGNPGRYEIEEKIGEGGFALVYRARDTQLDRLVALKELRPALLHDANWVKRFRREARTIARLDHPRLVAVHDVVETEGRLFIVMRLVDGPSLEELLARRGRLPWPEVVEITTAVAEGLDYAHAAGILHRDLKPANILIDPERGPMLTDFGFAKLVGESSLSVTAASGVVGTPHYIAPEVWEGKGATAQSDVYALGCILYEMVTGEKVFKGETPPAVMMAHFRPVTLTKTWPEGVPAGLANVVRTALAKNPADRYATAGELALALVGGQPARATGPGPGQEIPAVATPAASSDDPSPSSIPAKSASHQASRISSEAGPPLSFETSWLASLQPEPARNTLDHKWRGFLAHLGPYLIINGFLFFIYLLTDPGGYPWFLWPAVGWGVGLAFHLFGLILSEMKGLSGKWRGFIGHFGSYAIIMSFLFFIYLMADPGGYPWFLWPVFGWGVMVAIHLWATLLSGQSRPREERAGDRAERRAAKKRRRAERHAARHKPGQERPLNPIIQAHLEKARTYKTQIDSLIMATTGRPAHSRLQELAAQVDKWVQAIETLAQRIDNFQQNNLIQQDLESVPRSIEKLEAQLAQETDAPTRAELERTLANRKNQLVALQRLQNIMKRAEIKIESTLSALGTIYPQILTSQSTNHVADYSRLSAEVDEEVRTLQDHLEALEEVKLRSV